MFPSNESNNHQQHSEITEETDFRYRGGRDKPSDVRTALLTIAALLVAATYQAIYNPPGGLWQDDGPDAGVHPSATQFPVQNPGPVTSTAPEIKQVAGKAILATKNKRMFLMFIFGNTIGFFFSMGTIEDLTRGFTRKLELNLAIFSTSFTYGICVTMITPSECQRLSTSFILAAFALVVIVRIWREKSSH